MVNKFVREFQEKPEKHTSWFFVSGSVSTGLMHATPGEMKSFKSSADRIALIVAFRQRIWKGLETRMKDLRFENWNSFEGKCDGQQRCPLCHGGEIGDKPTALCGADCSHWCIPNYELLFLWLLLSLSFGFSVVSTFHYIQLLLLVERSYKDPAKPLSLWPWLHLLFLLISFHSKSIRSPRVLLSRKNHSSQQMHLQEEPTIIA